MDGRKKTEREEPTLERESALPIEGCPESQEKSKENPTNNGLGVLQEEEQSLREGEQEEKENLPLKNRGKTENF